MLLFSSLYTTDRIEMHRGRCTEEGEISKAAMAKAEGIRRVLAFDGNARDSFAFTRRRKLPFTVSIWLVHLHVHCPCWRSE